jgi:hypothetical protein
LEVRKTEVWVLSNCGIVEGEIVETGVFEKRGSFGTAVNNWIKF